MDKRIQHENVRFEYETPPTCVLLDHLLKQRRPSGSYNEVWPNIIISDAQTARDLAMLKSLAVTHVVNAAHGPDHIDTGPAFYTHTKIQYHGVEAADSRDFNITAFFYSTCQFIHSALSQESGKVLVHCARGISRSATLVLAYLMIQEGLTVVEAIEAVRAHRNILPNVGFLQQLRDLDATLTLQRRNITHSREQGQINKVTTNNNKVL